MHEPPSSAIDLDGVRYKIQTHGKYNLYFWYNWYCYNFFLFIILGIREIKEINIILDNFSSFNLRPQNHTSKE